MDLSWSATKWISNTNEDPAAVIGADEHGAVPALTGEYADFSACKAMEMQAAAWTRANNIHNKQRMLIILLLMMLK